MRYDWRNNWVLFVHNLEARPRELTFSVGLEGAKAEHGKLLINLLSEDHSCADDTGKHRMVIDGIALVGWITSFVARRSTTRLPLDSLFQDG
jgi:hypothetical protein